MTVPVEAPQGLAAPFVAAAAAFLRHRDPVLASAAPETAVTYARDCFARADAAGEALYLRRGERVAGVRLRELAFDTEIFGICMGKLEVLIVDPLDADHARELFGAVERRARDRRLEHVHLRLGAEDGVLIRAAEDVGFCWVSANTHFLRTITPEDAARRDDPAIRLARPGDEARLRALAAEAFASGTRFHLDPWLDPARGVDLHVRWASNTLCGPDAHTVLCVTGPAGDVDGFVTLGDTPYTALGGPATLNIGLIAVSAQARGHGVGRRLVAAALRRAGESAARLVSVSTESFNTAACRLYAACGFRSCLASVSLSRGRHGRMRSVTIPGHATEGSPE